MKILGESWRTGLTGILGILAALGAAAKLLLAGNYNFNDPLWLAVIAGLTSGLGNLNARDNKVSDEHAGAGVTVPVTEPPSVSKTA